MRKRLRILRMMKTLFVFMLLLMSCISCNEKELEEVDCASCENKKTIKELKDEPAIVYKQCFEHVGRIDTFYFELTTRYEGMYLNAVMPCSIIPEEYRIEGMPVLISGRVTNCLVAGGCSEPHIRLAPINVFELTSIKKMEK